MIIPASVGSTILTRLNGILKNVNLIDIEGGAGKMTLKDNINREDQEKILRGVRAVVGKRMSFDKIIDLSFGTCVGCGKKTGGFRLVNGQRRYICRDCVVKDWFPEEFGDTDIPWR